MATFDKVRDMDRILGYLAMVYIFLPWRPIVVLVAATETISEDDWDGGLPEFFATESISHTAV